MMDVHPFAIVMLVVLERTLAFGTTGPFGHQLFPNLWMIVGWRIERCHFLGGNGLFYRKKCLLLLLKHQYNEINDDDYQFIVGDV